jgi:anti-anti-sigma regulatory factor
VLPHGVDHVLGQNGFPAVIVKIDHTGVRVRVLGALDMLSAPLLTARLASIPQPHPDVIGRPNLGTVLLDLSDVTLVDTWGLSALLQARAALEAHRWRVVVTLPAADVLSRTDAAARTGWLP